MRWGGGRYGVSGNGYPRGETVLPWTRQQAESEQRQAEGSRQHTGRWALKQGENESK